MTRRVVLVMWWRIATLYPTKENVQLAKKVMKEFNLRALINRRECHTLVTKAQIAVTNGEWYDARALIEELLLVINDTIYERHS